MEQLEMINLSGEQLKGLPLFFRKIYFNKITDFQEDYKLMKYSPLIQCGLIRDGLSTRRISKTVDYKILNEVNHD